MAAVYLLQTEMAPELWRRRRAADRADSIHTEVDTSVHQSVNAAAIAEDDDDVREFQPGLPADAATGNCEERRRTSRLG
jgi:hypothetical protein